MGSSGWGPLEVRLLVLWQHAVHTFPVADAGHGQAAFGGGRGGAGGVGRAEKYPISTLADLYDPLTMPAPLLKAHQQLDRAVDRCYRPEPFPSDRHRVEYLFALYEKLTAPLVAAAKPARKGRKANAP